MTGERWTLAEAAEALGVSPSAVQRWGRAGHLGESERLSSHRGGMPAHTYLRERVLDHHRRVVEERRAQRARGDARRAGAEARRPLSGPPDEVRWTIVEAAQAVGRSSYTIQMWAKRGYIGPPRPVRTGRAGQAPYSYSRDEVLAYVQSLDEARRARDERSAEHERGRERRGREAEQRRLEREAEPRPPRARRPSAPRAPRRGGPRPAAARPLPPAREGVAPALEGEADRILRDSIPEASHGWARLGILSPQRASEMRRREVLVANPDPTTRKGVLHRAYNRGRPDLNSRDCITRPRRTSAVDYYERAG